MQQEMIELSIDDIADLDETASLFALTGGDGLEISLMDIVIAVISR